ncbi:beta-aspartyl-peptidase [Exiguobacterium antarcticum]|uniref:Isoaspartyl dipeptidase n=1 Tax=Exiguobacterium antarcticum TaxID=132920 RepID=A0ABT6R153_9BACL|nr:beta-aspartyl-peptidase [Exiguobacterium antarcticum]AFS69877.1 Isoaspartyl dipeptidase [Exiguobacterium antarcticum B7]MDI3233999.1 beta-aspartyl-peptidase [Exiguobacterium antarcticum]
MIILKNVSVAGESTDVWIGAGKVLAIGSYAIDERLITETIDGTGKQLIPGLIDGHVHPIGGGGEGGFATRTAPLVATDFLAGGVTTVVGLLGTDGWTRTGMDLLAHVRGYTSQGIRPFLLSGSYAVPPVSITNSIAEDILLINEVIGIGEIAINDHRSTQPTVEELARLASQARIAGLLKGVNGTMNVHIGDGKQALRLLEKVVETTDIPITQFLPTHINRSERIFEAGLRWAKQGGRIDFTTCTTEAFIQEGEVPAGLALKRTLDAGIPLDQITMSSDAGASLPAFDENGKLLRLETGKPNSILEAVRDAVRHGVRLEDAIQTVTLNVARAYGISGGEIKIGERADLLLIDDALQIDTILANGRAIMIQKKWLLPR